MHTKAESKYWYWFIVTVWVSIDDVTDRLLSSRLIFEYHWLTFAAEVKFSQFIQPSSAPLGTASGAADSIKLPCLAEQSLDRLMFI